jgi:hypothetical protein
MAFSRIVMLPQMTAPTSTASAHSQATPSPSMPSALARVSLLKPDRKVSGSTNRSLPAAWRTSAP